MRHVRAPRIVSVCVLGTRLWNVNGNAARMDLMQWVVEEIAIRPTWHPVDAIVFPGGYFRLPRMIGRLIDRDRFAAIEDMNFGRKAMELAEDLGDRNGGCHMIFGADFFKSSGYEWGDQFAIAMDSTGVSGLARKIFPTDLDTSGERPYVPYWGDFSSKHRILRLPKGRLAVLCSCYDVFALVAGTDGRPRGSSAIRDLWRGERYHGIEERGFSNLRNAAIAEWLKLTSAQTATVAVTTIHGFTRPGRDSYWMRHGITAASRASKGGLAVGAAHYTEKLPVPDRSTLASFNVPKAARTGPYARAYPLVPLDHFSVRHRSLEALVRLFAPNVGRHRALPAV